ncbi:hypothetical protein [Nocardioides mesophilus]|uniref:Esterase-like activity of phytase family protein n=1 Tax=Nocardioides mesophilus TaxID=433659 RepID=A0A7G9RDT2_9ACTN|nr:hypothetical protein [Nocardioides mesophilus]QNN53757.1 hypothetical protein H9L09_04925 [Nocardioides mesophilus]
MTAWASALAAVLLTGTGALTGTPLFSFTDSDITESSGLVDTGDVVYTINDSGAGPVLYAVDPATGDTVATTTYSDGDVSDVEALAPGPDGTVWVGDIGDNARRRDSVTVYRVTPGQGDAPSYELTYPDGPRDAETLLVQPGTGRLFVVSKTIFGGVVYAAPRRLDPDRPNRLRRFADVPGLLTDGAFLPDGEHVLLRGYGQAWLLTFPDFGVLASFDLPEQKQGEGLSVGADGRILLSSEGEGSTVLETTLPRPVQRRLEDPQGPAPTPEPSGSSDPRSGPVPGSEDFPVPTWAAAASVVAAAGFAWLVALGVRSRRRRH